MYILLVKFVLFKKLLKCSYLQKELSVQIEICDYKSFYMHIFLDYGDASKLLQWISNDKLLISQLGVT